MSSVYPSALDTISTGKVDATVMAADHAAHHDLLADAVNKLEVELGTSPSGVAFTTVRARLDALAFNVLDYGAVGDDATDDSAAFQACFNAAIAANGKVVIPKPANRYLLRSTITIYPSSYIYCYLDIEGDGSDRMIRWGGSNNSTVFHSLGWRNATITGVNVALDSPLSGITVWDVDTQNAAAGNANSSSRVTFNDCQIIFYAGTASCVGWRLGHGSTQVGTDISFVNFNNCFISSDQIAGHIGWAGEHQNVLNIQWFGGGAYYCDKAVTNIPTAGATGTQGGDSLFFYGFGTSHNAMDFEFKTAGSYIINGGRFENGQCFLRTASGSTQTAVTVTAATIATYTPADNVVFKLDGATSLVVDNCFIYGVDYTGGMFNLNANSPGQGILHIRGGGIQGPAAYWTVAAGTWDVYTIGVARLNSSLQPTSYFGVQPGSLSLVKALTYGTTITTDSSLAANYTIAATNGTAFTIASPSSSISGKRITYDIKNSSGGALGAITWGATFKLDATGFVNPANGKRKTISFYYDGSNWVQTGPTSADI